ncbi:MAG: hypothetical protein ACOYBS_06705 [Flavobacterium sp.]
MDIDKTIEIFEEYFPREDWAKVRKVSIKFKDILILKWFGRGNVDFYRRYFLKISYKDHTLKKSSLSAYDKNFLKQRVKIFNQYLKTL